MSNRHAVVAVYESHEAAEAGILNLRGAGVDLQTMSIIGRDRGGYDRTADGPAETACEAGASTGYRMMAGGVWSSFWGLMLGSAYLAVPGIGPVLAAGPVVGMIVLALESAVVLGGLTAIGAGLVGMGIPHESVTQYEMALQADKYLVLVHGTVPEVELARTFLAEVPAAKAEIRMFASGVVI